MIHYLVHRPIKKLGIMAGIAMLSIINQVVDAKTLACTCAYREYGVDYSVAYVAEGGGCCTGNASNGAGLLEYEQGGKPTRGYIPASIAQSLCCGPLYPTHM